MGKTIKNLSVVLGLITITFSVFYLYTQYSGSGSDFKTSELTTQNMLNNTKIFISRSETLSRITLDINLFEDKRFKSLQDYSTPIEEHSVGRSNPFADVDYRTTGTNF